MSAIAIVGMGCRFAGAPDLHRYWELLLQGTDAFGPVPADRWDAEAFLSSSARDMDRTTSPVGGFLDDVRSFPALALRIPPRRVEVMDPQQRFSLETALQAIEDAGYRPEAIPRRTGVFVGITGHEFRLLQAARVSATMMASGQLGQAPGDPTELAEAVEHVIPPRPFSAPGVLGNMCASIVAQELDLKGPAYTVDAACASSMVAVSDAVAQLRTGQIDAALVGGAYLQLTPEHYIAFSRIGAMSRKGACRPFDTEADGFVQGDGAAMVLLKRLDDALADGDRIYAVIEGVAVNNDGRGDGPMAPLTEGQADVMRQAWSDAGRDPATATHIEAHGTGTAVGDVAEIRGIREVFAQADRLVVGSSKANVGHTMSAAGVAGLIKAALSIHHRTLPPLAGFEVAKDALGVDGTPILFPTEPVAWDDAVRVAGVSSFGFGGTNAHAVLAAPPEAPTEAHAPQPELLLLSAPTPAELSDLAGRTAAALRADPRITVRQAARALALRPAGARRAAFVAAGREDLLAQLDVLADPQAAEPAEGTVVGTPHDGELRVAALFPGQGAQRVGMLRDLADRYPVVADTLAELEEVLADHLDRPLTHLLFPERRPEAVDEAQAMAELTATEHTQPVMLAASLALYALLERVGVTPAVVTGHSLGEFTAAAAAGVISWSDAARFVARRGRAMADLDGEHGAMAAVMAPAEEVRPLLAEGAVIANVNHPRQVVISGTEQGVDATVAAAEAAGVRTKRLVVSHAFHSPLLRDLDLSAALDALTVHDPTIPVASAIQDHPYADAAEARDVFARHATSPVVFTSALRQCVDAGANLFLQVGAGGPLASFARGTVAGDAVGVYTLAGRDDDDAGASLLSTLGQLWVTGVDVDLSALLGEGPVASLPPTVLPRESYWVVKDRRTRRLKLKGATARAPKAEAKAPEPAPTAPAPADTPDTDEVLEGVLTVVAKVSAYPKGSLRTSMSLLDDLGFDSLMLGDLAAGLTDAFPALGGIPQELLASSPSVGDLVDFVRSGGPLVDDGAADDDPLQAWRPVWTDAPLPDLPAPPALDAPYLVTGNDPSEVATVLRELEDLGIAARGAVPAEARPDAPIAALVWVGPTARPRPVKHVLGGDVSWPDQAEDLLAVVARFAAEGVTPDVLAVSRPDDVWAAGLSGALRALAREWPHARITHLRVGAKTPSGPHLVAEHNTADRTVDVHYTEDGTRRILALRPEPAVGDDAPVGPEDTVLITGGTRGLGLKLGLRLAGTGATILLLGRRALDEDAQALAGAFDNVSVLLADVTDRAALRDALRGHDVTVLVHAAGVLADGPVEAVDPARGVLARQVKVSGWLHAVGLTRSTLRRAIGVGSWAGAFGNRHQTHYAAANALLAALASHVPEGVIATVGAFGPWTDSAMADTIPDAVKGQMRAEGVDFVGTEVGLAALEDDLRRPRSGRLVHGRRVGDTTRRLVVDVSLSTRKHPYLKDHALDGVPVLPLAMAADLMAWVSARPAPLALRDLTLYRGITVAEPRTVRVEVDGARATIRLDDGTLCYRATLSGPAPVDLPEALPEPPPATTTLQAFYDGITFHGPLLQGLVAVAGVDDTHAVGTVRAARIQDWMPDTDRSGFTVDPLAVDSGLQLAGLAAHQRFGTGGTPVGFERLVLLRPLEPGRTYAAEVRYPEATADRLVADLVLTDDDGAPVLVLTGMVAELRAPDDADAPADRYEAPPEQVDPSAFPEVKDLKMRLDGVKMIGLQNPYFHVHEGTARDTTVVEGRELINFSSYNYIGLSGDPEVLAEVHEAVDRYGTSVSASRVASGERPFHRELETLLAQCQGAEDALLFTAGHATNVTTIGHLMGPDDLILHDEYIHDSALQGIKLSGASRRGFRHEDPDHLEEQLRALRGSFKRCLIIVEGVYSMDGDICQLPAYLELKERYGCLLMVDEAHSFGIVGDTGCGVREHFGIDGRRVDIWMGTLSKSLASCGGWISASADLITYLRYTAPGFVYSAGLTAANGVAALASLRKMLAEPERVRTLQDNATFFCDELKRHGLDTGPALGGSGVVPVITGNSMHALVLSERLLQEGINVQPIVYPAVPDDASRLRFFLSSTHSREQLRHTAQAVADTLAQVRIDHAI